MTDGNYLDINYLRALGVQPSFFGLGFIQFKIDERKRLHLWHPEFLELTGGVYDDEWHDHRYPFQSQVLVGSITNQLAAHVDASNGEYEVWEVCCEGNGADRAGNAHLFEVGTFITGVGETYSLHQDALHKATAERCMTLQNRLDAPSKLKARVVTKDYRSPNPFSINVSSKRLWEIMEDVVGTPGYHVREIKKGDLGEASKIQEELDELMDAIEQEARVMQLVELSDMLGATEAYLKKYHNGYSIDDLMKMNKITQRAFMNGRR